jgi:ribosomal protein L24E
VCCSLLRLLVISSAGVFFLLLSDFSQHETTINNNNNTQSDLCYFPDRRIGPGRGCRYVAKNGKLLTFIDSKCIRLHKGKKKSQRLKWTTAWRRGNKKVSVEKTQKKKRRVAGRTFKSIVGVSAEEIKKRCGQKGTLVRKQQQETSIRALKERKRLRVAAKKAQGGGKKKSKVFVKIPKSRKQFAAGRR